MKGQLFVIMFYLSSTSIWINCDSVNEPNVDSNEFDKLLSPRKVKTKYGFLQGILISLSPSSSSPSSTTSVSSPASPGSSPSSLQSPSSSENVASDRTPESPLKGYRLLNSVEAFLGVPYAAPPVNSLRFMPPVTPAHWRGTRLVNHYQPVCPQKLPKAFDAQGNIKDSPSNENLMRGNYGYFSRIIPHLSNQSEDCLYLNVYLPLPKGDSDKKLPVMVFIHGESYNWGSGNTYEGTILAAYGNIVVVTLNYRLGLFGFLPTIIDGNTRGNHGLMDIIAALHWIHDNIKEIGGDEKNVTLVGHSRGAAFVNLLMISPMSQGLFDKVILMSGSALSSWAISHRIEDYAKYLSKAVNCPNYDNILMVDCLRTKSMVELLKVDLEEDDDFYLSGFGPIIDGLVVPSDPRLVMESVNSSSSINSILANIKKASSSSFSHYSHNSVNTNIHSNGAGNNNNNGNNNDNNVNSNMKQNAFGGNKPYQLMFGVTRVEAPILFNKDEEKQGIDLDKRDSILRTLVRNMVNYYQEVISLTLINEYTDWSVPSEHPINILDSLIDILGDALVVAPITRAASLHYKKLQSQLQRIKGNDKTIKIEAPSIYSYVFVYQSESYGYSARLGCVHGDELPYLFGAPLAQHYLSKSLGHFRLNYSKPELILSEMTINQWVNFVKFGNPNGIKTQSKEKLDNLVWPEYDTIQRKYLMLGMKPKIRDHYHSHRLSFWLNLIPKLERHAKDETEHLKRHSQDQEMLDKNGQVSVFERISLKFPSSLQSLGGLAGSKKKDSLSSSPSLVTSDKSATSSEPFAGSNNLDHLKESKSSSSNNENGDNLLSNQSTAFQHIINNRTIYSTALSLTIAIGIVLLTINGLIFGAVYYYINKHRVEKNGQNGRNKFSPVRYVDIQSSLEGPSALPSNLTSDHHYAGFCCENHHLCPFTGDPQTHHLTPSSSSTASAHHHHHSHLHRTESHSSPLRSPPSNGCHLSSPTSTHESHGHHLHHSGSQQATSSGSSHVTLQPSITVASLNPSSMSSSLTSSNQVTSASQQQLTSSAHQESTSNLNDSCESKLTCQCDSCYHQQSICDNGHCLTVIHEFDEHL
ncbi:neuroligin-4, X-linked-like [Tetranychus urticae]|uniref:neuroligin-4, X-linked-like n=1 Tax=Tetranychus urticae TaxID=32264 RepID=UPI00077BD359|nr:neuroligin-4, X-linked-like [Tetranychus urticae]